MRCSLNSTYLSSGICAFWRASRAKHFACPSVHVKRLDVVVRVRAPVRPHMQAKKFADLRIRRNVISLRRQERASGARARVGGGEGATFSEALRVSARRGISKVMRKGHTTRGFGTQGFVNAVPEDYKYVVQGIPPPPLQRVSLEWLNVIFLLGGRNLPERGTLAEGA